MPPDFTHRTFEYIFVLTSNVRWRINTFGWKGTQGDSSSPAPTWISGKAYSRTTASRLLLVSRTGIESPSCDCHNLIPEPIVWQCRLIVARGDSLRQALRLSKVDIVL